MKRILLPQFTKLATCRKLLGAIPALFTDLFSIGFLISVATSTEVADETVKNVAQKE